MPSKRRPRSRRKDQPHDAVFKTFFGDARIAQKYLEHYTPVFIHGQIDFSFFRKSDTAFISSRFGISFCDVVYETRLTSGVPARLLFLFEHKSYVPNQPIHLQLLDYLLQIWEDDVKNSRPLSLVIPMVVYHGEKGWQPRSFQDYFPNMPDDWRAFIPDFHYLLTDLSRTSDDFIQNKPDSGYLRNLFLALKFARNHQKVAENWKKIFTFGVEIYRDDRERILFQTLTLYFVNLFDMPKTEIKELGQQLPEPEHSWIDAIPEVLFEKWKKAGRREGLKLGREEGRQIGREEGRQEGRQEGLVTGREETIRLFIINCIRKFPEWSDAEIATLAGATEEKVKAVRDSLKTP